MSCPMTPSNDPKMSPRGLCPTPPGISLASRPSAKLGNVPVCFAIRTSPLGSAWLQQLSGAEVLLRVTSFCLTGLRSESCVLKAIRGSSVGKGGADHGH